MHLLDFDHDSAGNLIGITVDYDGERIELERVRPGEWIDDCTYIICSECKAEYSDEIVFMNRNFKFENLKFCPNCGAKMDGGKQDG